MAGLSYDNIYKEFFCALHRGGIQTIAKTAYEILQLPIVIINVEYEVLAQVPEKYIGDLVWDTLMKKKKVPMEMVWQFKRDNYIKEVDKSDRPIYVDWGMINPIPRIMANFKVNGTIEGYVGVLFPNGGFTEKHLDITEIICDAISIELQKRDNIDASMHALENALMVDLFQGNIKDEAMLSKWLSHTNIKLHKNYCVAAARVGLRSHESSILKYIRRRIEEDCRNTYPVVMENTLFILFTSIPPKISYKIAVDNIMKEALSLLNFYGLYVGVSEFFDDLLKLQIYKYQADRALSIGLLEENNRKIYKYQDYVIYDIFSYAVKHLPRENYLHPAIPALEAFDKKNNTNYLETLRTYITTFRDSEKTRESLCIHRNTLLYRLKKIEELTGIDLNDIATCVHLLCNFYMENTKPAPSS